MAGKRLCLVGSIVGRSFGYERKEKNWGRVWKVLDAIFDVGSGRTPYTNITLILSLDYLSGLAWQRFFHVSFFQHRKMALSLIIVNYVLHAKF